MSAYELPSMNQTSQLTTPVKSLMRRQPFAGAIVFLLLCSVFVFRASALDITGVFQFEGTPSDSEAAAKLASTFSVSALEHYRDFDLTSPRFYTFTIDNQSQSATIVG